MKAFFLAAILLVFVAGCALHGKWSRYDRGAWANLDELIGSHEQTYYVKEWGEPVSRHEVKFSDGSRNVGTDGRELLWLWKPDGTGPSDQPGQGWEMFLAFNERGMFRNWRVGTYRTTLTIADVIADSRKFGYRFGVDLIKELGLSLEQHGIGEMGFWNIPNRNPRKDKLLGLQNTVRILFATTFEADTVARNLDDRLATENEVLGRLEEKTKASNRSRSWQHAPQGVSIPGVPDQGQSGLRGGGFLGPYMPNAYGPGMNADAMGRPFICQPMTPGPKSFDPFLQVQPNAYGPGVGMDQYGRPVRPACPPGWTGPC